MTHGFAPSDEGDRRRFRVHRPGRVASRAPRLIEPPYANDDPGCARFRAGSPAARSPESPTRNDRRYAPGGAWLASAIILVVAGMMALATALEQ